MKAARKKSNRRSKTVDVLAEKKQDTGLSPSKRHREKLNSVMDELSELLPLSSDAKSGLDRLTILKLTVSFFQTQNLMKSAGKRKQSNGEQKKKVHVQGVSLSELALEDLPIEEWTAATIDHILVEGDRLYLDALERRSIPDAETLSLNYLPDTAVGGFFIVLTEDGNVYYVSENVMNYLGYSQTRLMHQEFFSHVHPDDLQGLKACFEECPSKVTSVRKDEINLSVIVSDSRKECYCNIRCHAGRLSSHISPFYYKCFRLYGHLKKVQKSEKAGSQYGFFALCSPVNRCENVAQSIKEHVERYTCKMDAAMANLQVDSKGLKVLRFNEQDLMGKSAYFFFHPDDLSSMALVHERLMKESKASITFRIMKGNGKWQWVRGTGYSIIKNGRVQGMVANNMFVSDEEGVYYKSQTIKEMKEWKEAQEKTLSICHSSASSSSSCSSPSGSLDSESSLQTPSSISPTGFITIEAIDDTPIQTSAGSKSPNGHNGYVLPSPQRDSHQSASSSSVGAEPNKTTSLHCSANIASSQDIPESFGVIDSEMISIIKELQSSFIDGCDNHAPIQQPLMMASTAAGTETDASFNNNFYALANTLNCHHFGGAFDAPHIDLLLQNGQPSIDKHAGGNPSYLYAPKINGAVEDNSVDIKDSDPAGRLHEDSFKDFELLPLGDIESILSTESPSYSGTSDSFHPLPTNLPILEHVLLDSQSESYEQKSAPNLPTSTELFQNASALYNSQANPNLDGINTPDLFSFTFTVANRLETANRMDFSHKKGHGAYIEELKEHSDSADHHHHLHKNPSTPDTDSEPINGTSSLGRKLNATLLTQSHSAWLGRK